MYNLRCCSLHVEEERTTGSVLRPFIHLKNSLIAKRIKGKRAGRGGRDATSMIPRVIIIMRIIFMYVYIYNIYIYSDVYVRVRDQTLHCRLNKMRSHINILKTYSL